MYDGAISGTDYSQLLYYTYTTCSFGSLKHELSDGLLTYITYDPEYLLMFNIIDSGPYMCELSDFP